MAVYGVNYATGTATNGVVPFTGWSPTLGNGPANTGGSIGSVQFNGLTQNDYPLMANTSGMANRAFLAMVKAVTGAGVGGTATSTYKRVAAVQGGQQGGLIQVETVTPINRVTVAADVTALTALWNRTVNPASYPTDLSGAGGGGKLAFIGVS